MFDKSKELEQQDWYHGIRPRRDIVHLLRNPGEWLVRATDARIGSQEIVISVVNDNRKVVHFTVKYDATNDVWHLGVVKNASKAPKFQTIVQLVEHYMDNNLPGKCRLQKAILRPRWLIKHDKVIFDRKSDLLGSGNFCHVYKGTYIRSGDEKITVAVKICHEGRSSDKEVAESRDARNQMLGEAQLMSYYAHKNVIQFYGVACDHPPVLIVMEFCPGGNLEKHLQTHGDKISETERVLYALQAVNGMRYLHEQKCVHRDLAARNCLISTKGKIKISDFGLSQLVRDDKDKDVVEETTEHSPQVPIRWMAPESLTRPMKFSYKSDVWSYGVLLYEIFNNGIKPWPNDVPKKIATNIRRGRMLPMPDKTPQDIKEIVEMIWVTDPEKRPTMSAVHKMIHASWKSRRFLPSNHENLVIYTIPGVARSRNDELVELDGTPNAITEKNPMEPSDGRTTVSNESEIAATRQSITKEKNTCKKLGPTNSSSQLYRN